MKIRKLKTLTTAAIVYYNKYGKSLSYNNIRYGKGGRSFIITANIWRSKNKLNKKIGGFWWRKC